MSAPEAARAQFEYMAQGAEVPFVHIPVGQLEGWIQATEGEHLLAHREIDMAWLRMETAMTIVSRRRAGLEGDTELAPEALLDSAQDRLDKVGLQNANDPVVRSRAILASGSVGLYRSAVRSLPASAEDTEITTIDIGAAYAKQIEAAELLMRAATRRRGSVPLHDLHVQTTLLSLNAETTTTELIAMPLPSRLQEEGDVRSVDILVWDVSDARKSSGLYAARVSAGESALVAGHVVFGSNLLKNDGYPSEIGQGTLQAMIEQYHRRNMRRSHERVRHLDSVLVAHARHFMDQITCTEALSFETDPINGLSEARQWYHGISPLRNLTERDSTALEQCINPFENAYWARELSPEDIMTLAWLRVEMGNIFQRTDEPAHAEDLFTAIEERTAEQQDWTRYCQALAGRITARLYSGLYSERPSQEVVVEYRHDLEDAIARLHAGLAEPDIQGSRHAPAIERLLERLTTCYAITHSEDAEHLAVLASPRQQAQPGSAFGSDVLVVPCIDDVYKPQAAGHLRLSATTDPASLNRGVATADPALLRNAWHLDPDGQVIKNEDAIAVANTRLLAIVEPVLFM